MSKVFPTDAKTKFLMADDVRPEASGKGTIIGYYPGDTIRIVLPPNFQLSPSNPIAIPSLCIYWVFIDGQGDFDAEIDIIDSNGKKIFNSIPSQKIIKNLDGEANVTVYVTPLVIQTTGVFECVIGLDGTKYKRQFKIVS